MIIMSLLVAIFLVGYYKIWPAYVIPLVEKTRPIGKWLNTIKLCQTNYLDGQWTQWTEWSQCSVTCGQGTRTQRRYCAEPAPEDGGNDCIGENLYNSTCRWVTGFACESVMWHMILVPLLNVPIVTEFVKWEHWIKNVQNALVKIILSLEQSTMNKATQLLVLHCINSDITIN